jgi:hypothetical protein
LAQTDKALARIESTGKCPVTISPFVIARRVNQRALESIEETELLDKGFIRTNRTARLEVADVNAENWVKAIDRKRSMNPILFRV